MRSTVTDSRCYTACHAASLPSPLPCPLYLCAARLITLRWLAAGRYADSPPARRMAQLSPTRRGRPQKHFTPCSRRGSSAGSGGRLGGGVRLLGETRVRAMRCRGCFYAGEEKRTPERLNSSTMLRFVTVSDLGSRILLFNKYPSARNAGQQQQQSSRWHYADSQPLREQLCPRTCV